MYHTSTTKIRHMRQRHVCNCQPKPKNIWFEQDEPSIASGVGPGVISVGSVWDEDETNVGPWFNPNTYASDGPSNFATVIIENSSFVNNSGASAGVMAIQLASSETSPTVVVKSSLFENNQAAYTGSAIAVRNRLTSAVPLAGYVSLYNSTFTENKVFQNASCQGKMTKSEGSSSIITFRSESTKERVPCTAKTDCLRYISNSEADDQAFPFILMDGSYEVQDGVTSTGATRYHSYYIRSPANNRKTACPSRLAPNNMIFSDEECTVAMDDVTWEESVECPINAAYLTPVSPYEFKTGALPYKVLGGTLFIASNAIVNIYKCKFVSNVAASSFDGRKGAYGGAILVAEDVHNIDDQSTSDAIVNLFGNFFARNTAFIGGAVYTRLQKQNSRSMRITHSFQTMLLLLAVCFFRRARLFGGNVSLDTIRLKASKQ